MKRSQVYAAAALTGAVTGLRSMTGPAIVSRSLASGLLPFGRSRTRTHWLGAKGTANTLAVLAAGELIADKLPFVPDRISVGPLLGRFVGGGLCGAAICSAHNESPLKGALLGGLAATAAAFAGYELRRRATQSGRSDFAVAVLEDAVAIGTGIAAIAGVSA